MKKERCQVTPSRNSNGTGFEWKRSEESIVLGRSQWKCRRSSSAQLSAAQTSGNLRESARAREGEREREGETKAVESRSEQREQSSTQAGRQAGTERRKKL
jgi:hypothetical protein